MILTFTDAHSRVESPTPVFIESEFIVTFQPSDENSPGGTMIDLPNGMRRYVNETPEEVFRAIEGTYPKAVMP